MKAFTADKTADAPAGFLSKSFRSRDLDDHQLTIQVAPDDCTGCGICVDVCPAKDKTEIRRKAINMRPADDHRDVERARWDFFLDIPELDRDRVRPRLGEELAAARAAVRILRRVCGLRRDALPQAADAAVRRPARRRQRHRLLVDLRRQPADDAVVAERRRAAARRGRTRSSRTTPSSASGCVWASTPPGRGPAAGRANSSDQLGADFVDGLLGQHERHRGRRRRSVPAHRAICANDSVGIDDERCSAARGDRRRVGSHQYVDRRRRRLGVRHRLRRRRPRARPAGATSTCSCSTPRCTPTRAGRRRRPPRSVRSRSSRRPARKPARRISAPWRADTATSTSPRSPSAAATSRPSRR